MSTSSNLSTASTTSASTPTARAARPPRPQAILTVSAVERISPNLVRITAGGDGFDVLRKNEFSDKYVKIIFAEAAHGLVPPYDLAWLREHEPEKLPRNRTYTVRSTDDAAKQLSIDFVVHGDEGVAGPWASAAAPGDALVMMGAGGNYLPDPDAAWHLLIGDHTALPAISSALEAMPRAAVGTVVLSVPDPADRILPAAPTGLDIVWVDDDEALLTTVGSLTWRTGTVQVFAHGERGTIKSVRAVLKEHGIPRESISISAYWAQGRAEDQFQAEKREPIGKID